jgi:hypothetical protein
VVLLIELRCRAAGEFELWFRGFPACLTTMMERHLDLVEGEGGARHHLRQASGLPVGFHKPAIYGEQRFILPVRTR